MQRNNLTKETIDNTQKLLESIIKEERYAIEHQPELSEEEWKEFRKSHIK